MNEKNRDSIACGRELGSARKTRVTRAARCKPHVASQGSAAVPKPDCEVGKTAALIDAFTWRESQSA